MECLINVVDSAKSAMDLINVVPNPYYARSAYENDQLDTRIKFINLPKACTIRIFTLNGVLVRTLKKDNTDTYMEWDIKNEADIPVAGGVYLIHITDTKTKLTKTLKWFGIQRPTDVNAF
jgi:flagellar hook assembly protein FlgD